MRYRIAGQLVHHEIHELLHNSHLLTFKNKTTHNFFSESGEERQYTTNKICETDDGVYHLVDKDYQLYCRVLHE